MGTILGNCNNISEKYKFQWVAPERTGSRKIAEILTYYGFQHQGSKLFEVGNYNYNHRGTENINPDYKVICNARNPYGRTYSLFKNFYPHIKDKSINGFKEFIFNDLRKGNMEEMIVRPYMDKHFDYVIRLEYMKSDLMKLPFILDVLTESQIEMLSSHGKEIEHFEDFYDDEMKDIIYGYTEHQFTFWGYEK